MHDALQSPVNLFDFFHERVDAVASSQRDTISQNGIFYLSQLLATHGHSDQPEEPETLVDLMLRAQQGGPGAAIQDYRTLGDRALLLSGFFRAHVEQGMLSVEYYLHMGTAAYRALASLLQLGQNQNSFSDIFSELAHRFSTCAAILNVVEQEVRAEADHSDTPPTDQEILALYTHWQETGSPQAARRLVALGLLPSSKTAVEC